MGPPQTQGSPAVPQMGVRARVSNWSKKREIENARPPSRVDRLGTSQLDGHSRKFLEDNLDLSGQSETGVQFSRTGLVRMKRSNSEATISDFDFGSEDAGPAATLTRRHGSSSSVDLLSSAGFWEVLDQEPSAPPPMPEPDAISAMLSPSLQAAVQIARGDIVFVPGQDTDRDHRKKTETSVLGRLKPQRTNSVEVYQDSSCPLTPHRWFSHYDVQSVLVTVAKGRPCAEAPDLLPLMGHEDQDGDERSSALVLACPHFLNELGGEMDQNLDLTRPGSSTGTNAAVSVLEVSTRSKRCPADLRGTDEFLDLGATYYQKYFYTKDHQNYFGVDPKFGPVSLSVRRDAVDDGGNPTRFCYRIILRTGQLSTLRGSIMEDSVPSSKHGTGRGLPLKDVLEFVVPELNIQSLRAASRSPQVPDLLLQLDQQELILQHRVDLQLSRAGQNTGETSSPALTQFLNLLGHSDPVKSFYKHQDQQNSGNSTESPTVSMMFGEFQLTFHVSALLQTDADGSGQVLRSHHVVNDVTMIFQEPDAPPFKPQINRADLQHVFIIVRVHRPCTQHTCYSLAVSRSRGVPPFGPSIPSGWIAPASSAFVDFLLTKIINAKHATHKSESFVTMATRARKEQLKQLVNSFVTTTPLDSSSGVRFSLISLGGKKKERLAPHPLAYLQSAGALTWSVTVRDPRSSVAVACRLAVSSELLVLIEEAGRKVVFHCSCRDVIGWNTAHGSIQVFYQHGLCVAFSTRDGRWEDSQEITQRLKTVTHGAAGAAVTLRRNRLGQLGFHVNFEGVVADVEAHGFAWQAGLRPGCRLVEICSVPVATLSHEQMIELLRTSANVSAIVLPPLRDGTPRRSFSETQRLPLLEVRLDPDVTSCPYGSSAAQPNARTPSNQSPVQLSSSSDIKNDIRAPPDWFVGSDGRTGSTQHPHSRDRETRLHGLPLRLPQRASPADRNGSRRPQFAATSCSSCSNTLSSSSSDGRTSTPQLACLSGVSVDSGIDSALYSPSALPAAAGATLVLTDVHRKESAGPSRLVTDLRGSVARDYRGTRCSSADKVKPDSPLTHPGDASWDAERLCSQDTCLWEAGLSWLNSGLLLEETGRPSHRPIRGQKSTCRAAGVSALFPWKRLTRSRSHDSLSLASGRTLQSPAHILRRRHSAPTIRCRPAPLQKGVFPSSLTDHQLRYIQEVTSGSPALNSDITASLSGKVSQLEEILQRLQLDLLKEQQDKAALQQQIFDLRRDNLRLQEESRSAAQQMRRFAAWMLRRGSLP
ncbi:signal-induced proliferation-associated 1-like protein 2 isoform X1 [Poecilia latipinna]|uniref:Signal-induced proliferation-associated 1 like 2 n=1 Tax=Poecilia latipinna TaxID=48699 RepID=A0A3B3U7K6_9TELE|nr:PREDICTED: signal-induced proliferation-associated 1-like protein 2 isoform X1 [Poecilia latipinna]XP_014880238.1 PREDICTED: signal-induced proliferation-associated 1-like protein 2 isoform X1 [Poecilia latipinna]